MKSNQQKWLVKVSFLLRETKVSAKAKLQMGLMVVALMFLSVNDRGRLGYPTARSPKKETYVSVQLRWAWI
jgi:hypothetical protein